MQERIPYYERIKKKTKEEMNISNFFTALYHLALTAGAVLSIFYFAFVVEMMPRFASITDLTSYLIPIFAVALAFSIVLSLLALLPSFILNTTSPTREQKSSFSKVFLIFYIAIQLILIFIACFAQYGYKIFFVFLAIPIAVLVILYIKKWKIKTLIVSLKMQHNILNKLKHALIFMYPASISLFTQIPLIFLVLIGFLDTSNFALSIVVYGIISLLIGILLAAANKLFLDKVSLDSLQNAMQSIRYLALIFFATTSFISVGYMIAKKPNPIVIFPFKQLKFGYYEAELKFKKDFIEKSNPFDFKETNTTNKNIFFILSSIGDEYILQDSSRTGKVYRIKKDNVEIEIIGDLSE